MRGRWAFAALEAAYDDQGDPRAEQEADAAVLTDAEVLSMAACGLGREALTMDGPAQCRSLVTNVDRDGCFWQCIAARASQLCADCGVVLVPLTTAEAQAGVAALELGRLRVRDMVPHLMHANPAYNPRCPRLVHVWVTLPWGVRDAAGHALGMVLGRALRHWAYQVGDAAAAAVTPDTAGVLAWLRSMCVESVEDEGIS